MSEFEYDEFSDMSKTQQMFVFLGVRNWAEHGKFHLVENKKSNRPDLHAFILLDSLLPSTPSKGPTEHVPFFFSDIIGSAEHDKFYLSFKTDELDTVMTLDIALELKRCGVCYDSEYSRLFMFT